MVLLSWIQSVLNGANIEHFVMDGHMSVLEGSAAAIPRRVLVPAHDYAYAIEVLKAAEPDVGTLNLDS